MNIQLTATRCKCDWGHYNKEVLKKRNVFIYWYRNEKSALGSWAPCKEKRHGKTIAPPKIFKFYFYFMIKKNIIKGSRLKGLEIIKH